MTLTWLIAGALTAAGVAADINTRGPDAAVQALVDAGGWNRAMSAIASGARDWIRLAPDLARGTSETASNDLDVALAKALPVAAGDVLAVLSTGRSPVLAVQSVCGVPFAEGEVADLPGYIARARAAVAAAPAFNTEKAKSMCLKALDAAAEHGSGR